MTFAKFDEDPQRQTILILHLPELPATFIVRFSPALDEGGLLIDLIKKRGVPRNVHRQHAHGKLQLLVKLRAARDGGVLMLPAELRVCKFCGVDGVCRRYMQDKLAQNLKQAVTDFSNQS